MVDSFSSIDHPCRNSLGVPRRDIPRRRGRTDDDGPGRLDRIRLDPPREVNRRVGCLASAQKLGVGTGKGRQATDQMGG